ncbi:MAG: hypothetical protein IT546_05245 [Caulobacteraceae bacterium]|nr:hypothetical protein [Caulobacteraceae bacterium]
MAMLTARSACESPLRAASLTFAAALALATQARAGEVACSFEGGVLVAPAEVAGIAGDYIIDTGQPASVLHYDRAMGAGLAEPGVRASTHLAGLESPPTDVAIVSLDARAGSLPTPVAGVIGVDVLSRYRMEVRFSPCRLTLRRGGPAKAEVPLVEATVSDGRTARRGWFVVATGQAPALQLSATEVESSPPPAEGEPAPVWRVDRLSVGGELFTRLEINIVPPETLDPRAIGVIGAEALKAFRLTFDFPRSRLTLTPAR